MKSFRWTFISALLVIGLVAFTVFDNKRNAKKEELSEKDRAVVKLPVDKITHVEVINRVMTVVLERFDTSKDWRVLKPVDDLADQQAVRSYLDELESQKIIQAVVSGEEFAKAGLKPFGLEEPLTRLRLKTPDGQAQEVRIGTVKAFDSNLYAQLENTGIVDSRVLLVSSGWDQLLTKPAADFRDKRILRTDISLGALTSFTFKRPGLAGEIEIVKEGEHWKIKRGAAYLLDDTRVGVFLDQIKALRAVSFVEGAGLAPAEKALRAPALTISLFTDKKEPAFRASFAAEKPAELFARSSDLKELVKVNRSLFDAVDKTEQDFYDRKLAFAFKNTDVEKIEIDAKELKASFEKKAGQPWAAAGTGQKEADGGKITDLLVKLGDMSAQKILASADVGKALAKPSRLALKKGDGTLLFELAWGEPMVDKTPRLASTAPAAKLIAARTRKSAADAGQTIAINETDIKALDFKDLYKAPAPLPTAAVGTPKPAENLPAAHGAARDKTH